MSRPLKPWERARGAGAGGGSISGGQLMVSQANYPQTATLYDSSSSSSSSSSLSTTNQPQMTTPKIPPRPPPQSASTSSPLPSTSSSSSAVATSPTSSFGLQGYSGFGGGYGSSYYGGFSRPYGGFMGGSYGMFGQQQQQQLLNGSLIGKGVNIMSQVMEGFSRFSYFLGINFEAMRNFVVSFFGLYKGISPLFSAANSLSIIKLLKYISKKLYGALMWLCGVEINEASENNNNNNNNNKTKSKKAPLVVRGLLGAAVALSIPYFITQGLSFLKPSTTVSSVGEGAVKCKATHDFVAINQGEMSFKQGDSLTLLDAAAVPGQNSWGNAMSESGASGLVPLNYLTQLN